MTRTKEQEYKERTEQVRKLVADRKFNELNLKEKTYFFNYLENKLGYNEENGGSVIVAQVDNLFGRIPLTVNFYDLGVALICKTNSDNQVIIQSDSHFVEIKINEETLKHFGMVDIECAEFLAASFPDEEIEMYTEDGANEFFWRHGLTEHHTALKRGYTSIKLKGGRFVKYSGRFGKGYKVYTHNPYSTNYQYVTYWTK